MQPPHATGRMRSRQHHTAGNSQEWTTDIVCVVPGRPGVGAAGSASQAPLLCASGVLAPPALRPVSIDKVGGQVLQAAARLRHAWCCDGTAIARSRGPTRPAWLPTRSQAPANRGIPSAGEDRPGQRRRTLTTKARVGGVRQRGLPRPVRRLDEAGEPGIGDHRAKVPRIRQGKMVKCQTTARNEALRSPHCTHGQHLPDRHSRYDERNDVTRHIADRKRTRLHPAENVQAKRQHPCGHRPASGRDGSACSSQGLDMTRIPTGNGWRGS